MYLYGLDLSMSCSGVTVFDLNNMQPVFICSITTKDKDSHGMRLNILAESLKEIEQRYKPSIIAIERTFNRFPTSTAVLYKVHGLVNYLFREYEQVYYSPKEIKSVISNGNASKALVRKRIEMVYPDVGFSNEDESDSFAIALTWLIKNNKLEWSSSKVSKI
jgi:Holliday junction resolvasome RuvABC endonuclease subunit